MINCLWKGKEIKKLRDWKEEWPVWQIWNNYSDKLHVIRYKIAHKLVLIHKDCIHILIIGNDHFLLLVTLRKVFPPFDFTVWWTLFLLMFLVFARCDILLFESDSSLTILLSFSAFFAISCSSLSFLSISLFSAFNLALSALNAYLSWSLCCYVILLIRNASLFFFFLADSYCFFLSYFFIYSFKSLIICLVSSFRSLLNCFTWALCSAVRPYFLKILFLSYSRVAW